MSRRCSVIADRRDRKLIDQAGFSTIEAMVAIAILGIALIPLYSFQSTIISGTSRVEANLERQATNRLIRTYLTGLNPRELQNNVGRIGNIQLQWSIENLQPSRNALGESGLPGRFRVELVRINYQASDPKSESIITGSIDRMIWTESYSFMSAIRR